MTRPCRISICSIYPLIIPPFPYYIIGITSAISATYRLNTHLVLLGRYPSFQHQFCLHLLYRIAYFLFHTLLILSCEIIYRSEDYIVVLLMIMNSERRYLWRVSLHKHPGFTCPFPFDICVISGCTKLSMSVSTQKDAVVGTLFVQDAATLTDQVL
jgi:hypothetical protein